METVGGLDTIGGLGTVGGLGTIWGLGAPRLMGSCGGAACLVCVWYGLGVEEALLELVGGHSELQSELEGPLVDGEVDGRHRRRRAAQLGEQVPREARGAKGERVAHLHARRARKGEEGRGR